MSCERQSSQPISSAFSTNHLADIDKTKHNYNQEQHKNLNKRTRKHNAQTNINEATEAPARR